MKTLQVAAIFLVIGCSSSSGSLLSGPPSLDTDVAKATWHAIEQAEFARTPNPVVLKTTTSPDAMLRTRAVTALGRMRWPIGGDQVTTALIGSLDDEHPEVRVAAAFGLGMRADPAAGDALLGVAFDVDEDEDPIESEPEVRARALEAASKLGRADLDARILDGLDDAEPRVQSEAAIAAHRMGPSIAIDERLLEALKGERGSALAGDLLFSLQRRQSELAVPAFLAFARSSSDMERLWAVRGLARVRPSDEVETGLRGAVGDSDDRVAFEAVQALGAYAGEGLSDEFRRATTHRSSHVRAQALRSISAAEEAASKNQIDAIQLAGRRLTADRDRWHSWSRHPSAEVRRAAAQALPQKLVAGGSAWPFASDESPYVRAAWAERLGTAEELETDELESLLGDPHPVVVAAAIATLASRGADDDRDRVRAFVRHEDNGLRLAALTALAAAPEVDDLPSLEHAFFTSTGDVAVEVKFNALRAAAAIDADGARELLKRGLTDDAPFVRQTAREELTKLEGIEPPTTDSAPVDPEIAPLLDVDYRFERNPWVEITTNRGRMRFELFPFEAPWHVQNFVTLANEGHYDGLAIHRVVPDFVIQGGDYRGDGSGGLTVTGVPQRHEIGPRKFRRGSLGMPRHDDWDSGGSQFFVTHRPTPHLDGRYTIFGELRTGFRVLDRIEIGDTIVRIAEIDPPVEE